MYLSFTNGKSSWISSNICGTCCKTKLHTIAIVVSKYETWRHTHIFTLSKDAFRYPYPEKIFLGDKMQRSSFILLLRYENTVLCHTSRSSLNWSVMYRKAGFYTPLSPCGHSLSGQTWLVSTSGNNHSGTLWYVGISCLWLSYKSAT